MLKWVRKQDNPKVHGSTSGKTMNTSKKGNFTPQQMKKPPDTLQSNGMGTIPLSYPTEPPDDENMNEIVSDKIDLEVLLPEGKVKMVSVDPNIPMMDLLVNLAASSRLNPAGHTIVVLSEETGKPRDYKPNQTIGSLCGQNLDKKVNRLTIHLKSKKSDRKTSGNVPNVQPFETTYRFTINLPHKQKKVLRISPSSTLEQIHRQICTEKHFDPNRYHFQLITDPDQELDMQRTVGELGTNEINLINTGMSMDSAKSMPDLSIGRSQSVRNEPTTTYMPNSGEGKKKKGFFSIFKKDKKFNVQAASNERSLSASRSLGGGSPPAMRRKPDQQMAAPRPSTMYSVAIETQNVDVRPKSVMIENIQETPTNPKSSSALHTVQEKVPDKVPPPRTKKRRAPPPPQQQNTNVPMKTIQVEISVEKQNIEKQAANLPQTEASVSHIESHSSSEKQRLEQIAQKLHSRNSSDSSGYHELTLSGAESPEAGRIDECIENDYKISVDATSIDSGEHLNGDSGIRDISPPRRKKHNAQNMDIGASQTLPLNKVSKKDPARSRSLERGEQKMKVVGKKRKAAPPPPQDKAPLKPDKSQITVTSSSSPAQSQQSIATSPASPSEEASASLQPPVSLPNETDLSQGDEDTLAIEEVLGDLDRGLESPAMIMVENASLDSEDIEVDKTKHLRPCSFVAPPPPVEPPPPESQPVDYNVLIGHKVDTVDVGVETSDDSASVGPSSTKSSPISIHSRPASRTSITSVNTIEDISMAFELTIAAAEEAMLESDNEEDRKSTSSLQITKGGGTVELALNEEDELVDQAADKSLPPSEKSSPREEILANQSEDYEVSEITYNFTVDSVPTGFQMKTDAESSHTGEEITVESAKLIQPFESSTSQEPKLYDNKEDIIISKDQQVVNQLKDEVSLEEISSPKVNEVVVQEEPPPPPVVKEKPKEEPPKPKEKEVFVFKLDDLQDVNFSGPQKKKTEIEAKTVHITQETEVPEVPISPRVKDIKSIFQSENDGFSSPVIDWNSIKNEEDDEEVVKESKEGSVRDRCSELSFSPSSEGEQEHVLEEKSISMIALPAMRKRHRSPERSLATRNLFKEDTEIVSEDVVVAQNTETVESSLSMHDSLNVNDSGFEPDVNGTDSMEPIPSNPLQEQFTAWQEQLIQNQKLIAATQSAASVDESSLQLQAQLQAQLQMQKMMMEQMQQSMAALTMQQQKQTEPIKPQTEPKLVLEDKVSESIQPTPAAPPAAPPLPQNGMVHTGVKNTVASSAIEEKKTSAVSVKPKGKGRRIIEPPKLDPREELMIAIRNKGGISSLKKVPVNQTKWHQALS